LDRVKAHFTQYNVLATLGNGRHLMMGNDPRLPKMPARPRLADFFRHRFVPMVATTFCRAQAWRRRKGSTKKSSSHAYCTTLQWRGLSPVIMDIGEPNSSSLMWMKKVSWAVRHHQALRYFPDEAVGYSYPEAYVRYFGDDYQPPDYLRQAYEEARRHKWYMTSRLITVNDPYTFDPHTAVGIDDFEDVIGRHFAQPNEGRGFDDSPVSHMWRTMIWPRNSL
jgi:hypothetical protein